MALEECPNCGNVAQLTTQLHNFEQLAYLLGRGEISTMALGKGVCPKCHSNFNKTLEDREQTSEEREPSLAYGS